MIRVDSKNKDYPAGFRFFWSEYTWKIFFVLALSSWLGVWPGLMHWDRPFSVVLKWVSWLWWQGYAFSATKYLSAHICLGFQWRSLILCKLYLYFPNTASTAKTAKGRTPNIFDYDAFCCFRCLNWCCIYTSLGVRVSKIVHIINLDGFLCTTRCSFSLNPKSRM